MTDLDRRHLALILDCVEQIYANTAEGKVAFLARRMVRDATIRNFEVLAQAIARLPASLTAARADEWARIWALGEALSGQYMDIDLEAVWEAVAAGLTPLEADLRSLLAPAP